MFNLACTYARRKDLLRCTIYAGNGSAACPVNYPRSRVQVWASGGHLVKNNLAHPPPHHRSVSPCTAVPSTFEHNSRPSWPSYHAHLLVSDPGEHDDPEGRKKGQQHGGKVFLAHESPQHAGDVTLTFRNGRKAHPYESVFGS